ncbi:cytochrome P450 [Allorhizobium sp. BGMRC 0089]|uniref:cytochrome P450 n=1 Tax=Allorhizobium sonneratiae TaxID=2934936 RepID=UPI0020344703|nr:cytochrome P450 [Allorhizobium sonneratiae]MCM2292994.1 cytochrome P450 [Allorhizobium sonneratiae]
MTLVDSPLISEASKGIFVSRRSPFMVLPQVVRNPLNALPEQIYRNELVYVPYPGRPRLMVMKPDLIHDALVKNASKLDKGEEARRALGPALGSGLLTADGAHWKWQRQSVAAGFQWEKLNSFLPAMIDAATRRADAWQSGRVINSGQEMMRTTFDIIVETMMSGGEAIDVARIEQSITDYLRPTSWIMALTMIRAPLWTPYPGKSKGDAAVAYLRQEMARIIRQRRENSVARPDLISLLLAAQDPETGRSMNDEQVIDNLLTFITAGHETTALGLAWTLALLARHPDCEARVLSEIGSIAGSSPIAPEHIDRLVYTRQVFNEAMRLYPPAPMIVRSVIEPFTLGEHRLPVGLLLLFPIHALHRHRLLWERPDDFDPDRFAPEVARQRHRFAFMPFGAGPRICIGSAFATMEAVAILAVLLRRFRFSMVNDRPPEPVMRVTLRPKEPLMLKVEAR